MADINVLRVIYSMLFGTQYASICIYYSVVLLCSCGHRFLDFVTYASKLALC